jgi:propanol-preferring alcohol dehydrogenase
LKAVVLHNTKPIEQKPLSIEEVATPTPKAEQLLIKVAACGVCRSNLHMVEGDWLEYGVPTHLPIIPGHEVVGTVADVGDDGTQFKIGDRVGVQPLWSTCRVCEYCTSGNEQLCQSKNITGESVDGGYAEYMVSTSEHTYHLPNNLRFTESAPLFCPGVTAYSAVKKAESDPSKKVAIFGIGGVGHMALQFTTLFGATVVAVSRGSQHLQLATELGANKIVDVSEGSVDSWLKEIGPVDSSIVFAPSSSLTQLAIKATKPGGTIVIGAHAEVGEFPFVEGKRIVGSILGSRRDMQEVLRIANSGKVKAVCEEYPLENANHALQMLKAGKIRARAVLVTSVK